MNTLAQVKTLSVNGPNGPANAMMMAANVADADAIDSVVAEAVEQFKLNRMMAPPDTSMLLITLIGGVSAEDFAAKWQATAAGDEVVAAFMSMMSVADVVQGTPAGQQLSRASLLG